jgi:hypothetical protein
MQTLYNFDGLLTFNDEGELITHEWLRSGGVEAVTTSFRGKYGERPTFMAYPFASALVEFTSQAIQAMTDLMDLEPPFGVLVSLLGTAGSFIHLNQEIWSGSPRFANTDLLFPGIVIDDPSSDMSIQLRPVLDMIWQSAGLEGYSPS